MTTVVPANAAINMVHSFEPPASVPSPAIALGVDGNLYGTTRYGGPFDSGTVFRLNPVTGQRTTLHAFAELSYAMFGLIAVGPMLYGTTWHGGEGHGTIFRVNPTTGEVVTVHELTGSDGAAPDRLVATGSLVYGTTLSGGAFNSGTIFRFDPETSAYTVLYSFQPSDGRTERLTARDNVLYGVTIFGSARYGAVYRFTPSNGTMTVLHTFTGAEGQYPSSIIFRDGYEDFLWGTTRSGGAENRGTFFKLDMTTGGVTVVHSFSAADGSPSGLAYWNGLPYLTTFDEAHGKLIRLDFDTGTTSQVHTFSSTDGSFPTDILPIDSLYGVTAGGGEHDRGTLFKVDTADDLTVLHSFGSIEGAYPRSGLTLTDNGFIGTTSTGIYRWSSATSAFTALHRLRYGTTGVEPWGELTVLGSTAYGTTRSGGVHGGGTIYAIDLTTSSLSVEHFFRLEESGNSANGVMAFDGQLFGTTEDGGTPLPGFPFPTPPQGTVYRLDPASNDFATVRTFCGSTCFGGAQPTGRLVIAGARLFGVTRGGGSYGAGTVFVTDAFGSGGVIHEFNHDDGAEPSGTLLFLDGMLYGVTTSGGQHNVGTIFRISAVTGDFTVMYAFDEAGPRRPTTSLVTDGESLFGGTAAGGTTGLGAIYRFDLNTNSFTVLESFDAATGYGPFDLLLKDGVLYGTTSIGGPGGGGTIYSCQLGTPTPPTITPAAPISLVSGAPPVMRTLATVNGGTETPNSLSVTAISVPFGITVAGISNSNGTVTATTGATCSAATGVNQVNLQVQDVGGLTATAVLTVNVTNSSPTLGTYPATGVASAGATSVTPSAPPDAGSPFTMSATASAGFTGTISVHQTTGVVSIGNANAGSFTITVKATNACGTETTRTFSLTVNTPPVAVPQSVSVARNGSVAITLAGSDADGDTLTYEVSTPAANGQVNGTPPAVTYAPNSGYSGPDTFQFRVNDGKVWSAPATVSVNVFIPACSLVSFGSNQTLPYQGSATLSAVLDGTGPFTVTVSDGMGGTRVFTGNSPVSMTYSPAVTTTYTVTEVLGAGGCIASLPPLSQRQVIVTVPSNATAMTLTSNIPNSQVGEQIRLTARVTAASTPTGTVVFTEGATTLGTVSLSSGVANLLLTPAGPGPHTYSALFTSPSWASSNASFVQQVAPGGTTVTLASSKNPGTSGTPIIFTATVKAKSPATGTPTGNVAFYAQGTLIGTAPLSAGKATFTHSFPAIAATYAMVAKYDEDDTDPAYSTSNSPTLYQTIGLPISLALSVNPTTAPFNTPVAFTATLSGGTGTPTGTMRFYEGSTLKAAITVTSRVTTWSPSNLPIGPHSIRAVFTGTGTWAGSFTSPTVSVTITN